MQIEHFKKDVLSTSRWSGGTTTQLYIYPPGSKYSKRDFLFRLSTAAIEIEESVFTPLPGYARKLMLLDGKLELIHNDSIENKLQKFDVADFSGDWQTKSKGMARDFNLIYKKPIDGDLQGFAIKSGETKNLFPEIHNNFAALYISAGSGEINPQQSFIKFTEGDFICFHGELSKEIYIAAETATSAVFVQLKL
jgi:environmental stress-induced protein Ves